MPEKIKNRGTSKKVTLGQSFALKHQSVTIADSFGTLDCCKAFLLEIQTMLTTTANKALNKGYFHTRI